MAVSPALLATTLQDTAPHSRRPSCPLGWAEGGSRRGAEHFRVTFCPLDFGRLSPKPHGLCYLSPSPDLGAEKW